MFQFQSLKYQKMYCWSTVYPEPTLLNSTLSIEPLSSMTAVAIAVVPPIPVDPVNVTVGAT